MTNLGSFQECKVTWCFGWGKEENPMQIHLLSGINEKIKISKDASNSISIHENFFLTN